MLGRQTFDRVAGCSEFFVGALAELVGGDDDETLLSANDFADTFTTFGLPWDLTAETDVDANNLPDLS